MQDARFDDPRLARIYDMFNGRRGDLNTYLDFLGDCGARWVLDVGCGTGSFALAAAALGVHVTAADPARASLDVAPQKPGSGKVTWLQGDATSLPEMGADLAVMTGNAAQVSLTDESWIGTLRGIHRALKPGGYFLFETRNPSRRVGEDWAADSAEVSMDVPSIGVRYAYSTTYYGISDGQGGWIVFAVAHSPDQRFDGKVTAIQSANESVMPAENGSVKTMPSQRCPA